jgi:dienelactone hydrolase
MDLRGWLNDSFEIGRHTLRPNGRRVSREDGVVREDLDFLTAQGEPVPGILLRPAQADAPCPAILYIHAHGGRYAMGSCELTDGRPALQSPLGPVLAGMGFVVLSIDLPCFGARATVSESAAAKARLWYGRSLAGQMLGELSAAVGWMASRDDVDPARIGAFGLSMGATFAIWLAAVDRRLGFVAHECCYADFATLVETGAHDRHGIYLAVPGLLERTTTGAIAGLIAPRPQLVMVGDEDPLTPPAAVDRALADTRAAYAAEGAPHALALHREPASGHVETPAMRARLLAFLAERISA